LRPSAMCGGKRGKAVFAVRSAGADRLKFGTFNTDLVTR
jgi:hypothetical protein